MLAGDIGEIFDPHDPVLQVAGNNRQTLGVERDQVVVRRAEENPVADLQGRGLVLGAVAVAHGDVAGVIRPGDLQVLDVVAADLIERGEAAAAGA